MSISKELEREISEQEISDWISKKAIEEIKSARVRKVIDEAMFKVEKTKQVCKWLCVTAEDYHIMRKCLRKYMEEANQQSIINEGIFGTYFTANITIDNELEEPIGYSEDDFPKKYFDRLPLK